MAIQPFYFVVDATHEDFETMKTVAEASQEERSPGSQFGIIYNPDGTKVAVKVIGDNNWYPEISWYKHPSILGVYTLRRSYGYPPFEDLLDYMETTDWTGTGSPIGRPFEGSVISCLANIPPVSIARSSSAIL